jgi:hypothetical protein
MQTFIDSLSELRLPLFDPAPRLRFPERSHYRRPAALELSLPKHTQLQE